MPHGPLQHGSLLNQSMQAEKAIEIEDEQDKNHRLVISAMASHHFPCCVGKEQVTRSSPHSRREHCTRALNTGGRDHKSHDRNCLSGFFIGS